MKNFKYSWQQIAKASFVGIATTATFYLAKTTGLFSSWYSTEDSTGVIPQGSVVIPRLDHGIHERGTELSVTSSMNPAVELRDDNHNSAQINAGQRRLLQQGGVSVANPIPDQVIEATEIYQYDLSQVFTGNYTVLGSNLANGDISPSWITLEYSLLSNYDTPGSSFDVQIQNNIAYVADSGSLQVLNVSNPTKINRLVSYPATSGFSSVEVQNGLAYMVDGISLKVLNVSNSMNIIWLGSYNISKLAFDVQVQNGLAYVAHYDALQVLNVSNPRNITSLGSYETPGNALGVALQNNLAYVADDFSGLQVLNVSDPRNITYLGSYDTPGYARDVQVQNGVAYVADQTSGLQVLNVSDPRNITYLGSYDTPGYARDVQVQNGVAYVADQSSGLQVLDVSDPRNITYLGGYDTPGSAYGVQVRNGVAYVADYNSGLQVIALQRGQLSGTPTIKCVGASYTIRVSAYNENGLATYEDFQLTIDRLPRRVDTSLIDRSVLPYQTLSINLDSDMLFTNPNDNILILSTHVTGLTIGAQLIGPTLQLNPILLGIYSTDYPQRIQLLNGKAYVADDFFGLLILDVSNPAIITSVGNYSGRTFDVQLLNDVAYVANQIFGLWILNVSDPANITQLGNYDTPGLAFNVYVQNDIAYVADYDSGLQVLNVSSSCDITYLGSYATPGQANDVQVHNGLAYIADSAGLQILNVTNPKNITRLGGYPSFGYNSILVQNSIAYVGGGASLQILNVSNPMNITNIGNYIAAGIVQHVQVQNGIAYIADDISLLVLNMSNPKNITLLASYETLGHAYDVQVQNGVAYVAGYGYEAGVQTLDLTQWEWSVTPTVAEVGNYRITVTATDELGGSASASFQLRVEGPPRFNGNISTQYAKVGQAFSYFIPQGLVSDPNFDPITFSAMLANNQSLPAWLSFSGISAAFVGTPQSSQVGNLTIVLSATDNIAGSSNTSFILMTNNLPVVNQRLSNTFARVNQLFQLLIPNNTFSHPDGLALNYSAQLSSQAALPSWLRFNAMNLFLSGQPNATDAGSYDLRIIATDRYAGQASISFTLSVGNGVQVNRLVNAQLAGVGLRYVFAVPSDSFMNPDGTPFSLQSSALPSWLTFAATTAQFSGTPLASSRGTTLINITATDLTGGTAMQSFNLTVTYFPQVVTPIVDQIAPIGRAYQLNVSSSTFIDQNGYALAYRAEQSNGQSLPAWLNFNATTLQFFGLPNITQALRYSLAVIATNPLGAEGRDEFSLFAEHYPTVQQPIPDAIAGVDQPLRLTISGSSFSDLDNDVLRYNVTRADQSLLPNWLSFDAQALILSGTPLSAQLGNLTLLMTATDPSGGSAQQNFTIIVRYLPTLSQPVGSIAPVREGRLLNYTLPSGTFTDGNGATLYYNATQDSGAALPTWLNFNVFTQHFLGIPASSDVGALAVRVIADDGQGGQASVSFSFTITPNYPPTLSKPVSNSVASVNQPFRLVLPPDTFTDANADPLNYTASQVDGSSLPRWLAFDEKTITFSGTPGRSDTGDFSERIIPIRVTARDDQSRASTQFNINVQGTSNIALFLQIATPIATIFTGVFAAYQKRALCFNRYKKQRYQRLDVEVKAGEMFEYKFGDMSMQGKKVLAKTPRQLQGVSRFFLSPRERVPGSGDMPSWMVYDLDTNSVRSVVPVPDDSPSELIIQVKDEAGVVHEQFTLRVTGLKTTQTEQPTTDVELAHTAAL